MFFQRVSTNARNKLIIKTKKAKESLVQQVLLGLE